MNCLLYPECQTPELEQSRSLGPPRVLTEKSYGRKLSTHLTSGVSCALSGALYVCVFISHSRCGDTKEVQGGNSKHSVDVRGYDNKRICKMEFDREKFGIYIKILF